MTYNIHHIHVWPVARIAFIVSLMLGLVAGIFYLVIMGMLANFMAYTGDARYADEFFRFSGFAGVIAIFFLAFFQAVVWTVLASALIAVYNLLGGISVDIDAEFPPAVAIREGTAQKPEDESA